MLNKSERSEVLKILKHLSVLGPLPLEVDLTNWRLKVPKIKKLWICALFYILYGLHSFFITGSVMYNCFFVPDLQLHQVIIHAFVASGTAACTFWYYKEYAQDPGLFAKYAEWTLTGNVGGTPDLEDGLKKDWTRRLREYSMQDLIAAFLPHALMTTLAAVTAVYVYDPSMPILLYNYLPSCLQNRATFGILLVEEVRVLVMSLAVCAPMWQLHVTSFDLVSIRLQALKQKIESGKVNKMTTYRTLRNLQLYVSIFNEVNSYIIFTWKLLSISGCILCGFAAIAHFQERPIFGIMYYTILFDCIFMYAIIYEKAFKIPQLFNEAGSRALLKMGGSRRDGFNKQISSIQPAAITVGRFHRMERTSTLIFMDFVVTNIVSMLVAFG